MEQVETKVDVLADKWPVKVYASGHGQWAFVAGPRSGTGYQSMQAAREAGEAARRKAISRASEAAVINSHTPGPWSVGKKTGTMVFAGNDGGMGDFICEVCGEDDTPRAVNQANARLISAAPEMLKALVKAELHLAAIGTPRDAQGNYHKLGEWTFGDALPRDVDAREVKSAFEAIREVLAFIGGAK